MKRLYQWKVLIDGVPHRVDCKFAGDRYELYADGTYKTEVLRKCVSTMWEGMEEPVVLFGKECLFVVMDEIPDLVVDGRMLGKRCDYQKMLQRKGNRVYIGYGILLGTCILLLAAVAWIFCMDMVHQVGLYSIFIALGAAITMGLWSGKHLWRLTQEKNGSIIEDK